MTRQEKPDCEKEPAKKTPARYAALYEDDTISEEDEDADGVAELEAEVLQNELEKRKAMLRSLIEILVYCVIVVGITVLVKVFVMQPIRIAGSSMNDTLQNEDIVVLEKLTYHFRTPERFDVIVFRPYSGNEQFFVKRIIGLPGEIVYIDNAGQIHLADAYEDGRYENDRILTESYGKGLTYPGDYGTEDNPAVLGKDEFFVLGDNRAGSHDSRRGDVGKVSAKQIEGRVVVRLLPLRSFGSLQPQGN